MLRVAAERPVAWVASCDSASTKIIGQCSLKAAARESPAIPPPMIAISQILCEEYSFFGVTLQLAVLDCLRVYHSSKLALFVL